MCHPRRIVPVLVVLLILLACALPAAAQPAAEHTAPGLRWIELWQTLLAPFTLQTDEGRAIWDPNGGDPADAPPPSGNNTVDGMADGGGVPL